LYAQWSHGAIERAVRAPRKKLFCAHAISLLALASTTRDARADFLQLFFDFA
jgi:hypothetical protein